MNQIYAEPDEIRLEPNGIVPPNYTGTVYASSGLIVYYLNGHWHRDDGPAVIRNGHDNQFWLDDKRCSKEEWFKKLSEEQKIKALWNTNEW